MDKYTVYSKPKCPFCVKAKTLLDNMGIEYVEIDLTQDPKTLEYLKELGCKTVPQIFDGDDRHIGGFDRLAAEVQEGIIKAA